jgi:hypothetical protein
MIFISIVLQTAHELAEFWPYIAYAVGVVLRIVLPYLQERIDTGAAFDWRFVVGQLVGAVIGLVPLLGGASFLAELGAMSVAVALAAGWGFADGGRTGQKALGG